MKVRISVLLFLLTLGVPVCTIAQTGLGVITGQVTDSSGAVIPGAKVAAINTATGVRTESVTNSAGFYNIQELIPGPYQVEAEAANFKKTLRTGLTLDVSDRLGIDLKLEIGGVTETVTVGGEPSLLRSEDAETGEVVNKATIENLPILGGAGEARDVLSAVTLAGNVQGDGGRAGLNLGINGNLFSGSNANVRINGGRTSGTEYVVDGIPITQNIGRQISGTVPTVEDTAEFKVVTNGLGAQYGHLSGGAVNLTTQAGTNRIHGSIFEFAQFAALNANTWINNDLGVKKSNFHQNDFGIAMGGPVFIPHVYKGLNKTFWYANYEGSRYNLGGGTHASSVLTALERTGDVSDIGVADGDPSFPTAHIYDPYGPSSYPNQLTDPNNGSTNVYQRYSLIGGDGKHIPSNYLSPIIQKYLSYIPLPNRAPIQGTATGANYISQPKTIEGTNVYSIRVDQTFNDKSRFFARFTHNDGYNRTDPVLGPLSTAQSTLTPSGWGLTLNYDYTFSPTLLLNVRAGGNYSPFSAGAFLPSGFNNSGFGFDSITESLIGANNIPAIRGPQLDCDTVNACGDLGVFSQGTNLRNSTSFVYAASMTKILNRHTLQFGYEGRRYYDNQEDSAGVGTSPQLGYRFTSKAVNQYSDDTWNPQGFANGIGQFLLGLDSWTDTQGGFARSLRQNYYAAYVQDDYKAAPNVTLSYGLRWETESPVTDPKNTLTIWNPDAAAPFTATPGYNWQASLASGTDSGGNPKPLSPAEISQIRTPDWVTSGFPKGALQLVHTPEHPSSNATLWHPWNFSPRFGLAWQFEKNTVVRASLGFIYLPTGGALTAYAGTAGVAYSTLAADDPAQGTPQKQGIDLSPRGSGYLCGCIEQPFTPDQVSSAVHDNHTLNTQAAIHNQAGAIDAKSHMPLELDWSFGLQHQLPHGFLLEADYTANNSHNLLAKDNPGHFPAALYTGGPNGLNSKIYTTYVPSPTAGQLAAAGASGWVGPVQSVGYLQYKYPYFGPLQIQSRNIGKSNFEAVNLRLEHRLQGGFQILFNYTYSKNLDNVGGPEANQNGTNSGYGQGGKVPQDVQTIRDVYSLSGLDETHRVSAFYLYQLPFGRGRHWMGSPSGLTGNAIDYIVGGWNVSGDYVYHTGAPISFNAQAQGQPNMSDLNFNNIYGNYAPGATYSSLKNPHFKGNSGAGYDSQKNNLSGAVSAFDKTQFAPAQNFVIGTLPPIYGLIRQPGNWHTDLTVSKNLPVFSKDGTRYFQVRMDATNILNNPGLGGYDTNVSDASFGFIDKSGGGNGNQPNQSRHVQLGARFVF